jgi:hypothetical protein
VRAAAHGSNVRVGSQSGGVYPRAVI